MNSMPIIKEIYNMRTFRIILFAALLSITAAAFVWWCIYISPIYDVKEFEMDVYVDTIGGFNTDTDAIHFGILPPGAGGERDMTVTAGEFKSLVTMESSGDIAGWVSVSDNNFILEPYENMSLTVSVSVPSDIIPRVYRSGTMKIVFRRV